MLIHGAVDNDIHPPRFGGAERSFGLYRGLARRHEVRVLCVVPNRSRGAREETAAGVHLSRRRAWYTALAWRLERARLAPLWTASLGHDAAAARLAAELPGSPDVRALDFMLSGMMRRKEPALRVYLSQNVEADFFESRAAGLLARRAWAGRVLAFEARAARRADLVVACTAEDAARFVGLYDLDPAKVVVIENGWDETAVRPPTAAERRAARAALGLSDSDYVALFVGSDHAHNMEALAPLWKAPAWRGAGVKLLAVGSVTRHFRSEAPWLIARPETPDLLPVLHAADCGINPVATGGGSNVKVPTCLAAGLAVASTPFGMRGFPRLAPLVLQAEPAAFPAVLRERPRGWAARGESLPPEVAALAWGALGEKLGAILEARLAARRAPERRTA